MDSVKMLSVIAQTNAHYLPSKLLLFQLSKVVLLSVNEIYCCHDSTGNNGNSSSGLDMLHLITLVKPVQ